MCGILMLMSALTGVLILSVCITGAFMARRRRLHAAALQNSAIPTSSTPVNTMQLVHIQIPPDQMAALAVKAPAETDKGSLKECPICLESVDVQETTWASFPCTHGCCKQCLVDLLRHSSRRVTSTTSAVHCPLCRKMAVAPAMVATMSTSRSSVRPQQPSPVAATAPQTPSLSPLRIDATVTP